MTANRPAPVAASLQVSLLGAFKLRDATGSQIVLRSNKAILLLAFLALNAEREHSRERLIALLWSDRGERQGRASLRQALWELRTAFAENAPDPLRVEGESIGLAQHAVTVDAIRFSQLLDMGTPDALAEAVALYRGDLLEDARVRDPVFEDYLALERARFRDLALSALDRLMTHQLEHAPEAALETARRLLALDELHEGAHRAVMWLHVRQGRADLALRQYRFCHDALAREFGTTPRPETQALAETVRRGEGDQRIPKPLPVSPAGLARWQRALAAAAAAVGLPAVVAGLAMFSWWGGEGSTTFAPTVQVPHSSLVIGLKPISAAGDDTEAAAMAEFLDAELMSELRAAGVAASLPQETNGKLATVPRLVLQGRVTPRGDALRVALTVLDAESGNAVWTEHYDGVAAMRPDPEAVRTHLAGDVLAAISAYASAIHATTSTSAATAFVNGWHDYLRYEPRAIGEFERALRSDPDFALAHAALAKAYWRCWRHRCTLHSDLSRWFEAWERAEAHLEKAREISERTPLAHLVASQMLSHQGRHEEAIEEARAAVAADPEDADSRAALAEALTFGGRPRQALAELDRLRNRLPSALQLRALGRAQFASGHFEEAARTLERAASRDPKDIEALELLTSTYGHLELAEQARRARMRLTHRFDETTGGIRYKLSIAEFRSSPHLPGDRALFLTGLRLAGVPE